VHPAAVLGRIFPEEKNTVVEERKISKDKYIMAGVLTFLIFSLGLALGFLLEDHRYNLIEEINQEQDVNYLSLQLQYLYLTAFQDYDSCPILAAALQKTVVDLSESLEKVITVEEEKNLPGDRQEMVLRRYALDNLRYWLLAKESQERCNLDIVNIMYFYSGDCESCPDQGTILTYFKNVFGEKVLIFPINMDLRPEEAMVDVVGSQFNITSYPTIIINNNKYVGMVKKDQLQEIICSSLQEAPECR